MEMTNAKKCLSLILCFVLIAVTALFTTGCDNTVKTPDESTTNDSSVTEDVTLEDESSPEIIVLGTGKTKFSFTVTSVDGTQTLYEINTDKTIVGDALFENSLIAGENGPYGLYVKTVAGTTLDYDKDGKYWAFYIDGAYASTGVDLTEITAGAAYEFKAE